MLPFCKILTINGSDLLSLIFDNQLWLAIVAINITIIGLTSLADKRSVIGVEYGHYLLTEYKLFGFLRMYYLLIAFAVINAAAVVTLCFSSITLREVCYCLLVSSFIFALYYFFGYILKEHKHVRRQIIRRELSGLYFKSDTEATFEADRIIGMRGDHYERKISSDVVSFFSVYNYETITALKEAFGPNSPIYNKARKDAVDYSVPGTNLNNISWEFFQMFRYCDIQDKWAIEILKLFNNQPNTTEGIDTLRLNNVARMLGQINLIGHSKGLYSYKFLAYLKNFILQAVSSDNQVREIEEYLYCQLSKYIFSTVAKTSNEMFYKTALDVLTSVIEKKSTSDKSSKPDVIRYLVSSNKAEYGLMAERLQKDLYSNIMNRSEYVKNVVFDFGGVLVKWEPFNFFSKYLCSEEKARYFLSNICTVDWARRIDEGESFQCCVNELSAKYPEWEDAIKTYKDRWQEMVPGEIEGMSELIDTLKENGFKIYALSNWSSETFDESAYRLTILNKIADKVISGVVNCSKPGAEIFNLFLKKYDLEPSTCLFIDDSKDNIEMAKSLGMEVIHFIGREELIRQLKSDGYINAE